MSFEDLKAEGWQFWHLVDGVPSDLLPPVIATEPNVHTQGATRTRWLGEKQAVEYLRVLFPMEVARWEGIRILRSPPPAQPIWTGIDMARPEPREFIPYYPVPTAGTPWLLPDGRPPGVERHRPTLYACLPRAICGTFLAKRTITEGRTP